MAMMYGGMLYFPLKVSLFEEIALELIEARFGLKGTAAVMKLLCKVYKENGYYLKWDSEQCTLFTNKAGRDINEEEMQGIVDILVEKEFFDPYTYKEQQILTSTEIQKVWLEATKRRKRDLDALPYLMEKLKVKNEKTKEEAASPGCIQNQKKCMHPAHTFLENADNPEQSIVKQSKVEQSKVEQSKTNESKALPPLTPPEEDKNRKTLCVKTAKHSVILSQITL